MKRFFAFFLAAVMLIGMTACSSAVPFEPLPENEQVITDGSSIVFGDGDEDTSVTNPSDGIIGGIIGGGNLDEDPADTNAGDLDTTTTQTTPSSSTNNGTTTTKGNTSFADPATCSHDFKVVSLEDATCAKAGKKVSYCGKCDTTRTESIAKKTTHTGGKATCKSPAVCTVCNQPYGEIGDHYSANNVDDCTVQITCDTCHTVLRAAKAQHEWVLSCIFGFCANCSADTDERGSHNYKNGQCTVCFEDDPNYTGSGSGGNGGGSGSAQIDWVYTVFPVDISYGTITSATAEVSGSSLILRINMTRTSTTTGNKSMKGYYRISNSNRDTIATGSYSSSSIGVGASTTVTVTISNVITSSGKYYVFLSKTEPLSW